MPYKTYRAFGTSESIVARVQASLGTSYFGGFSGKARQFQAIDLKTKNSKLLYGYVRRTAPEGKELIKLLSDGNTHNVTLSIYNIDDETEYPLIAGLLSQSWIYVENNSAE